ncbi:trimethylamine methyltransferase family protein [Desulfonatronospira sp.]|uniref:trimethylamine methyltransferase family protein n=1 Tax=Desulfonatronospira sp. TaxID=1962951 RepID=UPI0025C41081|nr:trimethylamine methyltransferase family protein [Desulfonatronospira sp.]
MPKINQTIQTTPKFRVLSENQIEMIYSAALDVIQRTGARFHHDEALELFKNREAVVSDGNLVRVPISLVEKAIKCHPRKINLTGRTEKYKIKLEKDVVNFGTGSDLPFTYDRETGERRRTNYNDVVNAARIVDFLPNLDFFMSHGIVQDVPNPQVYDRHQFMAMLKGCTKPMVLTSVDGDGLKDLWKMASLFRGGEKEYRLEPMFVTYIEPISPLKNDKTAVEKLLFSAEKGIPCMYTPCPSSGATAPATMAGMLVQSLSETMMASVLTYLKNPGMPLIMGGVTTVLDMITTSYSYGAPELSLASAANTDISKWLGLPMFSTGGCTDAKVLDEQAAIESATSNFYAYLSGASLVHDVGYIDSGVNASLESLVMNDEIIGMIRQMGKGINTEDEYLALELIDKIGPGGEYLTHEHTLQHYKEWFQPRLQDRSDYETWVREGKKTMNDRIKEETERILKEHQPEPIDDNIQKELQQIIDAAEKRHSK